jgi:hypothetical protein
VRLSEANSESRDGSRKRKWCHARVMSVLPLKADIRQHEWHFRLVPKADIRQRSEYVCFVPETDIQGESLAAITDLRM